MRPSISSLAAAIALSAGGIAIAAPASAQDDYRFDDRRGGTEGQNLQRLADRCIYAVERDRERVDTIDTMRRTRNGWDVSGRLATGGAWSCEIDNRGRIRDVDVDRRSLGSREDYGYGDRGDRRGDDFRRGDDYGDRDYRDRDYRDRGDRNDDRDYRYDDSDSYRPSDDREWTADDYARARARTRTPSDGPYTYGDAPTPPPQPGPQRSPTYPGGPMQDVDPDDGYGLDSVSGPGGNDGRYDASRSPDFR